MSVTDLEAYVWQQSEGLSVEPYVEQQLRVMHVVGQLSRWREVAEGHHLLGAVDNHRLVDVSASGLRLLLQRDIMKGDYQKMYFKQILFKSAIHITTTYFI